MKQYRAFPIWKGSVIRWQVWESEDGDSWTACEQNVSFLTKAAADACLAAPKARTPEITVPYQTDGLRTLGYPQRFLAWIVTIIQRSGVPARAK